MNQNNNDPKKNGEAGNNEPQGSGNADGNLSAKKPNPILSDKVAEKDYALDTAGAGINPQELTKPIEEPKLKPPPIGGNKPDVPVTGANPPGGGQQPGNGAGQAPPPNTTNPGGQRPKPQPINDAYVDTSGKEREEGAEMLANTTLETYGMLLDGANKLLTISEKKIQKLVVAGELDLSIVIPFSPTRQITCQKAIEDFNKTAGSTFELGEEFVDEVKPLLVKVFKKHNAGLTDEQRLGFCFGKHIVSNIVVGFAIKQKGNEMVETMKEFTASVRIMQGMQQPRTTAAVNEAQPEAPKRPEPISEPEEGRRRPVSPEAANKPAEPVITEEAKYEMVENNKAPENKDGIPEAVVKVIPEVKPKRKPGRPSGGTASKRGTSTTATAARKK